MSVSVVADAAQTQPPSPGRCAAPHAGGKLSDRHNLRNGSCFTSLRRQPQKWARRAHLVGVPQADGAAQGHLPHQQVVHPAEGELQVPHLVLLQVPVHLLCGQTGHCQEPAPAPTFEPPAQTTTKDLGAAHASHQHDVRQTRARAEAPLCSLGRPTRQAGGGRAWEGEGSSRPSR